MAVLNVTLAIPNVTLQLAVPYVTLAVPNVLAI
jgi:hypothetical protein